MIGYDESHSSQLQDMNFQQNFLNNSYRHILTKYSFVYCNLSSFMQINESDKSPPLLRRTRARLSTVSSLLQSSFCWYVEGWVYTNYVYPWLNQYNLLTGIHARECDQLFIKVTSWLNIFFLCWTVHVLNYSYILFFSPKSLRN